MNGALSNIFFLFIFKKRKKGNLRGQCLFQDRFSMSNKGLQDRRKLPSSGRAAAGLIKSNKQIIKF